MGVWGAGVGLCDVALGVGREADGHVVPGELSRPAGVGLLPDGHISAVVVAAGVGRRAHGHVVARVPAGIGSLARSNVGTGGAGRIGPRDRNYTRPASPPTVSAHALVRFLA